MLLDIFYSTLVVIDGELWECLPTDTLDHDRSSDAHPVYRKDFRKINNSLDGSGIKSILSCYRFKLVLTNFGNVFISGNHPIVGKNMCADTFTSLSRPTCVEEIYYRGNSSFVMKKGNKLYLCNKNINKIHINCNYIYNVYYYDKLYIIWTDTGLWIYCSEDRKIYKIKFDDFEIIEDICQNESFVSYNLRLFVLVNDKGLQKIYEYDISSSKFHIIKLFTGVTNYGIFYSNYKINIYEKNTNKIFSLENYQLIHHYGIPNIQICEVICNNNTILYVTKNEIYFKSSIPSEIGIYDGDIYSSNAYMHKFLSSMPLDIFKKYAQPRIKNARSVIGSEFTH